MTEIRIRRWAAWAPGLESEPGWRAWARAPAELRGAGAPEARFLPPLLRRRCDALSRMMLHVAEQCCPSELRSSIACVFASRHGSFGTTVALLEDLARDAALSPARFSHSVHNAQAGLFSIWAENRTASMSLAAGPGTFAHAFLEAVCLLHRERGRPVLLVHGDEEVPDPIVPLVERREGSFALALLLASEGPGPALRFAHAPDRAAPVPAPPRSGGLEFLRWWLAEEPELRLDHEGGAWSFARAQATA
jgi:hypothetical protein